MALDREDRFERSLQAFALAGFAGDEFLQKSGEGLELSREQKRHRQHDVALGKALADTFLLGK